MTQQTASRLTNPSMAVLLRTQLSWITDINFNNVMQLAALYMKIQENMAEYRWQN